MQEVYRLYPDAHDDAQARVLRLSEYRTSATPMERRMRMHLVSPATEGGATREGDTATRYPIMTSYDGGDGPTMTEVERVMDRSVLGAVICGPGLTALVVVLWVLLTHGQLLAVVFILGAVLFGVYGLTHSGDRED